MKKYCLLPMIFLMSLMLLLVACSEPEVTTQTDPLVTTETPVPQPTANQFDLFRDQTVYILAEGYADPDANEGEWPGVVRAANDLKQDIIDTCSLDPVVVSSQNEISGTHVIIVGSLEKGTTVKALAESGKIDVTRVEGKWESYQLQVISDPFGDGRVDSALVIFGSDKRGTIYGIYELSEMLGVSPLKYFADSMPNQKDSFTLPENYLLHSDEPSVKYRGIFLNDEEQLEFWARQLDGDLNMGPNVYKKIFEMLLRMKANYLWPAMHVCVEAFNNFPENPKNADYYGIVIGTSHCDMLLRNNLNEWDQFKSAYRAETGYTGTISYDYTVCPEIVEEYWRRSVRANKDYEVQWTLGMRGAHDEGFTAVNLNQAPWYGDSTKLLEEIIELQRQILREELNNPTLDGVFQVFIPYKEVQAIYNDGLELPDDVMIMWADDNHGFVRNLPNAEERERSGGHGIYYHNSYWGPDDESYMWLNTMPLTLFYEEMSKAIRYDADTAWIINVGDIKPGEISMEFLLDYAFHADTYTDENVYSFIESWAKREFPSADASMITSIEKRLCQYTNARKLEHMKVDLFTNIHFNDEFEKRLSEYQQLLKDAEAVYTSLPDEKKATFYETVLYQVRSAVYSNAEFFYATKANFALEMGKSTTAYNCTAMSQWYNELKKYETAYYNKVLMDGKWNGIMTPEEHDPPVTPGYAHATPAIQLVQKGGGVIVEGEYRESDNPSLAFYNYAGGRKFIDVFSKGVESFDFKVVSCPDFVILSQEKGTVHDEVRIWVSVDFTQMDESQEGNIVISYCDGLTKTVHISARVDHLTLGENTYVEQDGYISMEAEHYSVTHKTADAYFTTIKDLGRVEGDMIKVISEALSSVSPEKILSDAPYVEYQMYFLSVGDFVGEVYRLPTLNAKGKVRFAVQLDNETPIILSGESDYGVNNYAWEEGVFNQIIKHKFTVSVKSAGSHTLRIYMIDPELCYDKIVIYTEGYKESYFGPNESYHTVYNQTPDNTYEPAYETRFLPILPMRLVDTFGHGYFVEDNGQIRIETAAAIEQSEYAYTEHNELNGGFMLAVTPGRYAMRTAKRDVSYVNRTAPSLNYRIYVAKGTTYTVSVEVLAPSPTCDSFFLAVDGVVKLTKNDMSSYDKDETYAWHSCGSITLSAGVHTISILAREDGLSISKLVLSAGSYSSSSATFTQTPRTSNIGEGHTEDVAVRKAISVLLSKAVSYDSVPLGSKLGDYSEAAYRTFLENVNGLVAMLNSEALLTENAFASAKESFDVFKRSKVLKDADWDCLIYDDFDGNNPGSRPFGVLVFDEIGEPDANVYTEGDTNFLALRTFKLQSKVQTLMMGYTFEEAIKDKVLILESKVRFNEAKWADIFRVKNTEGKDAVVIAIERISDTESAIVAYNHSSKEILAIYKPGTWVTLRVEINVERSSYNVYINGEKANEITFRFRNKSDALTGITFGVKNADTNLNFDYIKAYRDEINE